MMRQILKHRTIRECVGYSLVYSICFMLSRGGHPLLAGGLMTAAAFILYVCAYRTAGSLVNLQGLFSLSWIGGQGIACLQLSKLQVEWSTMTWLCFFLVYISFRVGDSLGKTFLQKKKGKQSRANNKQETLNKRVFTCMIGLTAISVICFIIEVIVVGFIPLFSELPHAYSYFHVSGVHYFTISCILCPGMSIIYKKYCEYISVKRWAIIIGCNFVAVSIPILCVSRFQLLFAFGFAAIIYLLLYNKWNIKIILIGIFVMIPVYVVLTMARNHDITYLNSIFEMKNSKTPIFITQPYMYIANNYENFNCMVTQLAGHTWGLKMLFPIFALTGLKFIFPQLTIFPAYITKPELTTLTMFYDAYYDFGVIGIVIFGCIIGVAANCIVQFIQESKNPLRHLFYGQMAVYLALSFFTTWFSNPTTWFWFVLTGVMYLFVGWNRKAKTDE